MINKKGFTLVELLAVIVILAIIIGIATPAFGALQTRVNQKQYENKIELIKVAALKYADDTNYVAFYVEDLVKAGYLEGDKKVGEDFQVIDNRDGKTIMNCYVITITESMDQNYAEVHDKTKTDEYEGCPANLPNEAASYFTVELYEDIENNHRGYLRDFKELTYDKYHQWWTKNNTKILVKPKPGYSVTKYEWYKGTENDGNIVTATADSGGSSYYVSVDEGQVLQQNYIIKMTFDDGKVVKTVVRVYIDKINPEFYTNSGKLPTEWVKEVELNILGYDNESGLFGYKLLQNGETTCPINRDDYNQVKKYKITENGTYRMCLMDQVGNVSGIKELNIQKVDNKGPECKNISGTKSIGESTTWLPRLNSSGVQNTRTIKQYCSDNGSGCKKDEYEVEYNKTTKTDNIEICDKLNNCTLCPVDVYLDVDDPKCGTSTGGSTTWLNASSSNKTRNITQKCSDVGSGCNGTGTNGVNFNKEFTTSMKTGAIEISDIAGNKKQCSANVYLDLIPPTCTYNGKTLTNYNASITTWVYNTTRSVKIGCSDTVSGCDTSISDFTFSANNSSSMTGAASAVENSRFKIHTIKDIAGNVTNCGANSNETVKMMVEKPSPAEIGNTAVNLNNKNKISTFFKSGDPVSGVIPGSSTCKLIAVRKNGNSSWQSVTGNSITVGSGSENRTISIRTLDNKCIVRKLNDKIGGYNSKYDVKIQRCYKTYASGNQEVCSPEYEFYDITYHPTSGTPLCNKNAAGYYQSYYKLKSTVDIIIDDKRSAIGCNTSNGNLYFSQSINFEGNEEGDGDDSVD